MPTLAPTTPVELAKQALSQVTALATLPEVTAKVIKTVEDPKSSAQQLHGIVKHDPALVSRVLKVVNSAFYGLPGQVTSIDRAIVLLGLNAVKNLAIAASLGQMFRGVKLTDAYSAKDLWSHCVAVAVVGRELAKGKATVADEAFLGGMIHDIGLLVALQGWPERVKAVCQEAQLSDRPFVELEKDLIGVNHGYLGKALAERWQFPKSCQSVAAYHHTPLLPPEPERTVVAIVAVADVLCCQAGLGFPLTAKTQTITPELLKAAGLTAEKVEAVRARAPELFANASPMVG